MTVFGQTMSPNRGPEAAISGIHLDSIYLESKYIPGGEDIAVVEKSCCKYKLYIHRAQAGLDPAFSVADIPWRG